jgi:L-arabinonolactonase
MNVETVVAAQNILGEGPLWSVRQKAFYWVDIEGRAFFRLKTTGNTAGEVERFPLEYRIGALALTDSDDLILALEDGLARWDMARGKVRFLPDNVAFNLPNRFNDGKMDRRGRFWAGTMSDKPENSLYRLDPDGSVHEMETGVVISNGIGWSPDNRIMYYSDSGAGVVYAYDFDIDAGTISNRREFLRSDGDAGVADGLTVDAEGFIWSAFWNGWRVARFNPQGEQVLEIPMPVQRPTSCVFGGSGLNELYITSASMDLSDAERAQQPQAGDVFRVRLEGVRGLPEPEMSPRF